MADQTISINVNDPNSIKKGLQNIAALPASERKDALTNLYHFQFTALALAVRFGETDTIANLLKEMDPKDIIDVLKTRQPKGRNNQDTIFTYTALNYPDKMPSLLTALTPLMPQETLEQLLTEKDLKLGRSASEIMRSNTPKNKPQTPATPQPVLASRTEPKPVPVVTETQSPVVVEEHIELFSSQTTFADDQAFADTPTTSPTSGTDELLRAKEEAVAHLATIIDRETETLIQHVGRLQGTLLQKESLKLLATLYQHRTNYRPEQPNAMLTLCNNYLIAIDNAKPLLVQHRDLFYWARNFLDLITSPLRALTAALRHLQNPEEAHQHRFKLFERNPKNDQLVIETTARLEQLKLDLINAKAPLEDAVNTEKTQQFNEQITKQLHEGVIEDTRETISPTHSPASRK